MFLIELSFARHLILYYGSYMHEQFLGMEPDVVARSPYSFIFKMQ